MFPKIEAMKITSRLVLIIALDLLYVGLLHTAQAVTPPPDGGYEEVTQPKGKALSLTSRPAHTILPLACFHSRATLSAASTRPPARGPFSLTLPVIIPLPELGLF
jgi:hypothetical protein